jgi:hypothetical protein
MATWCEAMLAVVGEVELRWLLCFESGSVAERLSLLKSRDSYIKDQLNVERAFLLP